MSLQTAADPEATVSSNEAAEPAPTRVPSTPLAAPAEAADRAGLIRGQTSAHRGLRTFAKDRSRNRER